MEVTPPRARVPVSVPLPVPSPEAVAQRLKVSLAGVYLTLVSIIQGVALSTLVGRIAAGASGFGATEWVLAASTFLVYLITWNEYVMGGLTYVWMPTLLDAALPFLMLASELFLAYAIASDPRGYLLADGALCLVAFAQYGHTAYQVQRPARAENTAVRQVLERPTRLRVGLLAVAFFALAATWALYDVVGLGREPLMVAIIVLVVNIGYLLEAVPYWNRMLAYAKGERAS